MGTGSQKSTPCELAAQLSQARALWESQGEAGLVPTKPLQVTQGIGTSPPAHSPSLRASEFSTACTEHGGQRPQARALGEGHGQWSEGSEQTIQVSSVFGNGANKMHRENTPGVGLPKTPNKINRLS